MKRFVLFIITLFLFITACGKSPTESSQRNRYEFTAINPHYPPTFNIFINDELVGFIDADKDSGFYKNMGEFPEGKFTHFQSFFADSPFSLLDDTTISTITCDSVILIIGCALIAYYED